MPYTASMGDTMPYANPPATGGVVSNFFDDKNLNGVQVSRVEAPRRATRPKARVECLECGKVFAVSLKRLDGGEIECSCGGYDVELL